MSESIPDSLPAYLRGLNPPQLDAVRTLDGPLLVLAGAGTGKTRVLTTRIAHLLVQRKAFPGQILAVTFTNKAAAEMRGRVAAIIGETAEGMWLGTFHALAARILRRHAELAGLKSNFTILDQDDQIRLIKQLLQAEGIDDKRWPARIVHGVIERWKDRGLTPSRVTAEMSAEIANGRAVEIYAQYQERLKTLNAADFGDLLLHTLTIFQSEPTVLAEYHRKFKYVLVDEYQDTNVAQYLWLRILAQGHKNICCVGDDDQSIYGWRGAEIGNILKFEQDFPGAKVVRLEQNYRSTEHILSAASALIAHNRGRLGKTLWTADKGGEKVVVKPVWDGEEEARFVGEEIEARQRDGVPLSQVAVLMRTTAQTREFEERFLRIGLKYRVVGSLKFYERKEIRDAIAYFRVTVQEDDDLAFERILNVPKRGLADTSLRTLSEHARARRISLHASAFEVAASDELKPAARRSLTKLLADFDRWRKGLSTAAHGDLVRAILDESGYTGMLQEALQKRDPEAAGRLDNLKELVAAVEEFETLPAFLEHVALVMDNADNSTDEVVSLMTLHAAKGLEFDVVFLPGWEEGLFPSSRALAEKGSEGLEEERRLAHVGLTRARRRAYVSCAASRRVFGETKSPEPSRFLRELPASSVEMTDGRGRWDVLANDDAASGFRADRALYPDDEFGADDYLDLRPGMRVFHKKFGYGRVVAAELGQLEVDFEHSGVKSVISSYVRKA